MASLQILNLTHAVGSKVTCVGNKLNEMNDKVDVVMKGTPFALTTYSSTILTARMFTSRKGRQRASSANFKRHRKDEMFVISSSATPVFVTDLLGNQIKESLRRWVMPPDPATNHNIACDMCLTGTAEWFLQGNILPEWKSTGSFLWIHGKRRLFRFFLDHPLTAVCVLSWLRQKYSLVRCRSHLRMSQRAYIIF